MSKKWGGEGGCLRVAQPLKTSRPWRHGLGRHASYTRRREQWRHT
jgi:hypothetical protein